MTQATNDTGAPTNNAQPEKSSLWIPILWLAVPMIAALVAAYFFNGG